MSQFNVNYWIQRPSEVSNKIFEFIEFDDSQSSQSLGFTPNGLPSNALRQFQYKAIQHQLSEILSNEDLLNQIPILKVDTLNEIPNGSLVRFRAMIQDPSFGQEVFVACAKKNGRCDYFGFSDECLELDSAQPFDHSSVVLEDRDIWCCVSIPGLNQWCQEDHTKPISTTDFNFTKYPLPNAPHVQVMTKVYPSCFVHNNQAEQSFKVNQLVDMVGILGSWFNELEPSENTGNVRVLHCMDLRLLDPFVSNPWSKELNSLTSQFTELSVSRDIDAKSLILNHLTQILGGDELLANYLLLLLISQIYSGPSNRMGINSMNINLPDSQEVSNTTINHLISYLKMILSQVVEFAISIDSLNQGAMNPQFKEDQGGLHSGCLQLPNNTFVIIDETLLGEGQLNNTGVTNLLQLTKFIKEGKVSYIYDFFEQHLDSNNNVLTLSNGKSLLPCHFSIPYQPKTSSIGIECTQIELQAIRSYLVKCKHIQGYLINQEMSDYIETQFVQQRQSNDINHHDLSNQLEIGRLITLSNDESQLSLNDWEFANKLESNRKLRIQEKKNPNSKTEALE